MDLISETHQAIYDTVLLFTGRSIDNGLLAEITAAVAKAARISANAIEIVDDRIDESLSVIVTAGRRTMSVIVPCFGRQVQP